ncbi:MAG: DUF4832 domain-containing protein [Lachnospiraceae bacterium]|nr:DUF4832 domain-containing protein [Lachnospiraceae bacterium]
MVREATHIRYFERKEEEGQNPYIGFVSFQHFRDEALYSDVIVRPENNLTETENFEGYPIPDYVPQKGREEGFYPDTTVAYIRILWKEFEPRRREYNIAFIEEILSKAKACGQTVMFRLMAHSTRESDDVPDWLKEIIPCPKRPDGERVKDSPTDPRFFEYFAEAVIKIAEQFDDDPTLDIVDISLPGAWGEGHNLDSYPEEELQKWMDLFTNSFKNTRLLGQVSTPKLVNYGNETRPVGWRADGTGNDWHMHIRYPSVIEQMPDVWKKAPISFESYWWLGEWKRKGWDIDEIIKLTLEWHISTFNAKSLPIPNEWREKIQYWNSKMGYHFALKYFRYPKAGAASDVLEFELGIENDGVAPIYNDIPVKIRLTNDNESYVFCTDIDIREWMPGKNVNKFSITLPEKISAGRYDIEIGILGDDTPMIYLCTDAVRNGRYYKIGEHYVHG